jgi:Iap family predicted aminopeptidase
MKNNFEKKRTLTPQQVEEVYGIPAGTLANLRCQGRGAKYHTLGNRPGKRRRILYFIEDIEFWIRKNPIQTIDSIEHK